MDRWIDREKKRKAKGNEVAIEEEDIGAASFTFLS